MLTEEDLQSIKEDRIKYGITDQVLEKNKNVNNTDVNINNTQKTLSERMKEYGLSPETPDTAIETPDIEEDKQGLLNTLSEVYTGVGKSTLSTIKGALTPIIDLPKNIGALFGKSIKGTKDLVPEELTKAQNKNEEIGRAIGEISQFFLMPVAKGAKLADTAPKIQKAANVLLRGLQEAGMVAGLSSLQSEEFGKEQLKEGAIAGAFPIVGAIAKPVLKGLGKSLERN